MLRLYIAQRLCDAIDRTRGNSGGLQLFQPVRRRLRSDRRADQSYHLVAVGNAHGVGRKPFVTRPFGMAANSGEPGVLSVVAHRNDDRLIGRVEWLVGQDVGMRTS